MNLFEFQEDQRKIFTLTDLTRTGRPLSAYKRTFEMTPDDIKQMNNKKLLLVGGGYSPIQKTFDRLHINCAVTNVDPYISAYDSARTLYKIDFVYTDFINEFDECWALFSLPLYSPDIYHAGCFYARAALSLKPGGVLRVGGLPQYVNELLDAPHINISTHTMKRLTELTNEVFETTSDTFKKTLTTLVNKYQIPVGMRSYIQWTAPTNAKDKIAANKYFQDRYDEYIYEHKYLCR